MERSPYTAPAAETSPPREAPVPAAPLQAIDLVGAFTWPGRTPGWWRSCAIIGLWSFVPIVGWVVLTGWSRRVYSVVRTDPQATLPPPDLRLDLGGGWRPFLAWILVALVPVLVGTVAMGLAVVLSVLADLVSEGLGEPLLMLSMVAFQVLYLVAMLAFYAYATELWRLTLDGQLFPPLRLAASLRAVRTAPTAYLVASIGIIMASSLTGVGLVACLLGVVFTLPWGMAVSSHLAAQWARVTETAALRALSAA